MSAPHPATVGRLLREPLVWFVVLGGALFGLHRLVPSGDAGPVTPVGDDVVAALVAGFEESGGRSPTATERAALIEAHADEQRALREARELGLDRADPVVRRRLLQKLAFLDAGVIPEPDDATLQAFLDAQADRYARPPRTDGAAVRLPHGADADAALLRLAAGVPPGSLGEPSPHPPAWVGLGPDRVAERTTPAVAEALTDLPRGVWQAVADGDRTWLVRVDASTPAGVPALAEIRETVRAGWQEAERERRLDAARAARRERWPTVRR